MKHVWGLKEVFPTSPLTSRKWHNIWGVIKKYGVCLNKKKYCSKRHIAINPPQNTPSGFEHGYPIVLATFWNSSWSPVSCVSLVALLWLPPCPESIQNIYLSWSFWLWGRARSCTVPDLVNKVDEAHRNIFIWQKLLSDMWHGVLSWWRIKPFAHFSGRFLCTSFLKRSNKPL